MTDSPLVRPRFARVSVVVLVLLLPLVAESIWDYVESRRLRARVEAITARHEPLSMRSGGVVRLPPDEEEAALLYRAAAALASRPQHRSDPAMNFKIAKASREHRWPADVLTAARLQIAERADALALADQAARLPIRPSALDSAMYPTFWGESVALVQSAERRAEIRAQDGDDAGAAESLYTALRARRAIPNGSFSTPIELDPLTLNATARSRLADALGDLDRDDRLQQQLLRMRGGVLAAFQADNRARLWLSPVGTWNTRRAVADLDAMTRMIDAAARPWPERIDAVGDSADVRVVYLDRDARLQMATTEAKRLRALRCQRLRMSPVPIALVDPLTGRSIDIASCAPTR